MPELNPAIFARMANDIEAAGPEQPARTTGIICGTWVCAAVLG